MTIEIHKPELEALIHERMRSGSFQTVDDLLMDALKSAASLPNQSNVPPAKNGMPDWRKLRGMAAGGDSLTQALMEERADDKAHDEARVQGR